VPAPETAGLKVPSAEFVIPVPLQVPPEAAAERLKGAAEAQTGATGQTVVLQQASNCG
jgi:hypothetical protein